MQDDHPANSPRGAEGRADASQDGPAKRALAEAEMRRQEARRREAQAMAEARPREIDGRPGPEPVRYGDWENKGLASDF